MESSLIKSIAGLWELATPKNISYIWGFGRALGLIIIVQIISGVLLAFYYVSGEVAWNSVVEISREVNLGWLIRLIHRNTASFVFVVLFMHFIRGLTQRSFYLKGPWIRGWAIIVLVIIAAFLGYVLPWGQISFWGATVIINLLSILPKGKLIVIWLWGGFYVSAFTCRFFYALHFLVPFVVLLFVIVHLFLLHFRGSRVPGGVRTRGRLKIKFTYYFLYKDIVNLTTFWAFWIFALVFPDWSADPVNFMLSDLSRSPIHIQPEWYFLHLYAVLRSIPNKLGGLVGFAAALIIIVALRIVRSHQSINNFVHFDSIIWRFIGCNIILIWLGRQPVEAPFIFIGQVLTFLYFFIIFIIIIYDIILALLLWRVLWIANSLRLLFCSRE